jgi:(p)ppGpp synthase/HD superfamily hydrolase
MGSFWSQEKYIRSLRFAAEAHNGQLFPGTDLPYVIHVTMVAMEVIAALAHEDGLDGDLAVQCALLHDVIEDAGVSFDQLSAEFGPEVADGVLALSKAIGLESKHEQMQDSLKRIKKQPSEIWIVKLGDRITNLQPPPKKWYKIEGKIESYREEGRLILSDLGQASRYLAERLRDKLRVYPLEG